jgi:hypothetical protein
MDIKLEHIFLTRAHDLLGLVADCNKLSTFCTRLEKQSILFPDRYDPNKYKGDGFELLIEALIKLSPVDNRIGISNYQPCDENNDKGIDGYGIGIDGMISTVQIKYRSNNTQQLTANSDHLSNFTTASKDLFITEAIKDNSLLKYIESKNRMLIVTTADGLHHFTDNEMFSNKVRCIGYQQLRELLDNNILFWNTFRKLLK